MSTSNPFAFIEIPATPACKVGGCVDYAHVEGDQVSTFQIVTFSDGSKNVIFCFKGLKDQGLLSPGHPNIRAAFIEEFPQWENAEWFASTDGRGSSRNFVKEGSSSQVVSFANLERDFKLPALVRETIERMDADHSGHQAEIIEADSVYKNNHYSIRNSIGTLEKTGTQLGIAVVLVGENLAGEHYVQQFTQVCNALEVALTVRRLHRGVTEEALLKHIHALNVDPTVYGIVIPDLLPIQIKARRIQEEIKPEKAVEGGQSGNMAAWRARETSFEPYVVLGIKSLLEGIGRYSFSLSGQHVVIVTDDARVSEPLIHFFMQARATVTVCDSNDGNLVHYTRSADILIAATGKPKLITGEMVKKGAVVIDWSASSFRAEQLIGDVDAESVGKVAKKLSSPLLGLGPVAIVALVQNTVKAARLVHGLDPTTTSRSTSGGPFLGVLGPMKH